MTDQELKTYNAGLNASWQFFKHYATTGDPKTDDYWTELIHAAGQIDAKYNSEMIRRILIEMIGELERRAKA